MHDDDSPGASAVTGGRSGGRRLPWWSMVLVGFATAGLGAALTVRPFTSLSVLVLLVGAALTATGVTTLWSAARAGGGALAWIAGVGWIVAGVLALAWPDITTWGLALVAGISMIVGGVVDVVASLRRSADQRLASMIGGAASVVFGILALTWPDVTLLVVAVVFGARTVLFGLRLAWSAWRDRDRDDAAAVAREEPDRPGRLARAWHLVGACIALVVALALASLSATLRDAQSTVDEFYDTPTDVPPEPGEVLRVEPFTQGMPDDAEAYRVLYTTTRGEGEPAVASALVIVPSDAPDGRLPVIAWAHGTTGFDRTCAPSVMSAGLGAGAFYLLDEVLDEGWALVATDYVGLGTEGPHPYLIGQGVARSVLDAVRAARQMDEVDVADDTVVWGHSQGGGAALWTGQVAPGYAPDVELAGVAALAPASDVSGLIDNLATITGGSLFASYVVAAYTEFYPELRVEDLVVSTARPTFTETSRRCLDASALASVLSSVATGMSMFVDGYEERIGGRLDENVPTGPIVAPLLLGQGAADQLVLADVQAAYVGRLCDSGQPVDYRTYPGRDHVPLVEPDSPLVPELLEWTHARLAGEPATSTCPAG